MTADEISGYSGIGERRASTASCWLCGATLHTIQLTPDGGEACTDVRWYCRDVESCTGRWTSARQPLRSADALAS